MCLHIFVKLMYLLHQGEWIHRYLQSGLKFTDKVEEHPLLLLFDGHVTHISIPVIREALNQQIVTLKFPPHVTDVLQPLDVAHFGPLKRKWEKLLHECINKFGAKHQLTKLTS